MKSSRKHHWLVAGTVYFSVPKPDATDPNERLYGETTLNAMVTGQHQYMNARRLGQAQQALQLRAADKVGNPDIKMEDVVIRSISYLGHMSDEEFSPPQVEQISVPSEIPLG